MQKRDAKKGTGLDELFLKVGLYRHSEDLRELFLFIRKFPRLAPYNAFLIHIQKPGCQFVAEEDVWLNKYNRRVIPGSRPLVILWPFAPVESRSLMRCFIHSEPLEDLIRRFFTG